ncbi:hypothetical protein [Pedobacter sp. Leaf132]|uniref:hypothetical protein n=1 Tax=Pedobacter sp. Leaf132 TaxID=2876557 RepID=UPI001E2FC1A4|nr:hypothetical protein [Pedobacter sp. Leaf132]
MIRNKMRCAIALGIIAMLNPSCKHGSNDATELYRRYAIKNLIIKQPKPTLKIIK